MRMTAACMLALIFASVVTARAISWMRRQVLMTRLKVKFGSSATF